MYWIDTHVHLSNERLKNRDEIVDRMVSGNYPIRKIVEVPVSYEDNLRMRDTMKKYQNKIGIGYAAGIHPLKVTGLKIEDYYEKLIALVNLPNTVAIGETGLDWYRVKVEEKDKRQAQLEWFQLFSWIALRKNLPLILHIRGEKGDETAYEAYELLKLVSRGKEYRGVVHSCSLSKEDDIERFLRLGFHIGLSGASLREEGCLDAILNVTPWHRLLLETDSPYLVYPGHTSKRTNNEPKNLEIIAQMLSKEIGYNTTDRLMYETTKNANTLFWSGNR